MKLTKRESEFLVLALQWAEQDRKGLADAYAGCTGPEEEQALGGAKKCRALFQKIREYLRDNGGRVLLTTNTILREDASLVEVPIEAVKKRVKAVHGDWEAMDAVKWAKTIYARKVIDHIKKKCPRLGIRRVLVLAKKWIEEGRELPDA
jgi:hypothetical protein